MKVKELFKKHKQASDQIQNLLMMNLATRDDDDD